MPHGWGDTTHGDKREQGETKESWPSRSESEEGAELEGILFHKMHGPLGIVYRELWLHTIL